MKIKSSPKVPVVKIVNASCLVGGENTGLRQLALTENFYLILLSMWKEMPTTNMP